MKSNKLKKAQAGLTAVLNEMERTEILASYRQDSYICKRCALPSKTLLKSVGDGVICLSCLSKGSKCQKEY